MEGEHAQVLGALLIAIWLSITCYTRLILLQNWAIPSLQLPATDATDPWKIGREYIPKDCLFPCFRLKKNTYHHKCLNFNILAPEIQWLDQMTDGFPFGAWPVFRGELLVAGEGGRHVPRILSLQEPGDSLSCWLTKVSSISASSKSMTFWRPKNYITFGDGDNPAYSLYVYIAMYKYIYFMYMSM